MPACKHKCGPVQCGGGVPPVNQPVNPPVNPAGLTADQVLAQMKAELDAGLAPYSDRLQHATLCALNGRLHDLMGELGERIAEGLMAIPQHNILFALDARVAADALNRLAGDVNWRIGTLRLGLAAEHGEAGDE